ncbi:hypothetical protein OAD66_06150 [Bacteroidia bacterium]|nr:hypothetical protein [Bacteroidia bacterium]MDB9882700.1 hypothetical protein [Bacteroidia bacterium]
MRSKQNTKLNWAMFYASLHVAVALPIVNSICVSLGFWKYTESSAFSLPANLYFIWVVLFSVHPVFLFKGKHILLIAIALFWLDLLLMPQLAAVNLFSLNSNWLYGEILIKTLVFLPAYFGPFAVLTKNILALEPRCKSW